MENLRILDLEVLDERHMRNINGGALPLAVIAWKVGKAVAVGVGAYLSATSAVDAALEIAEGYNACRN